MNASARGWRYPYATIGGAGLANYSVSVRTPLTQPGTSAGLIGRLPQPLGAGRWHRLSLAMSRPDLTAAVDGRTVAAVSDPAWTAGLAGIEAGAGSGGWPQAEYRDLSITR